MKALDVLLALALAALLVWAWYSPLGASVLCWVGACAAMHWGSR